MGESNYHFVPHKLNTVHCKTFKQSSCNRVCPNKTCAIFYHQTSELVEAFPYYLLRTLSLGHRRNLCIVLGHIGHRAPGPWTVPVRDLIVVHIVRVAALRLARVPRGESRFCRVGCVTVFAYVSMKK